jgi:anaerobic magnesium-protoporphyrin IX monomethyl ester cyclase
MKIHVTLVNPPYPVGAHTHPPFIQLGIGYLAAVLEKNQYEVDVIDCQAHKLSYEEFKNEVSKRQPNMVGITSTTLTYKSALNCIKIIKDVCPNCLTVLGGVHVTFWDSEALQECPSLDIVVRKEGEITLLELAKKVESGNTNFGDVLGITFRNGGEVTKNQDRPYVENLDDLPFPAHHLWSFGDLRKDSKILFPITTSRGCVYWCDFCTAVRMFGRKYRMRSPKNVVDELEFVHKTYGARRFTFYDDAFTVDAHRTEQICDEIKARNLKINWNCETRVDMVTKDLLVKMKKSGCTDVWFGIESGSQKLINAMGKGISLDQTINAFKWAKEAGLMTVGFVIIGFPGETKESLWQTIKLVQKIGPCDVVYHVATPYPGTPMREEVIKNGWLKVTDFDKYDTATPIFETPELSMEELREIREQAFQKFYLSPTYVRNMIAHGGVYGSASTRLFFAHLRRAFRAKLKSA